MAEEKPPGIWAVESSILREKDLELFESGYLADVDVRCGDRTWKLHKVILCTQSAWFKKALAGSFKESETGVVTLPEQEQCDIDCFLKFLYTGSIDLQKSYPGDDAFIALIRIWKTANFFQQKTLCDLAVCAGKDYAKTHALVFCKAFPGAGHDEGMEGIMENSFNPAVSLLYGNEMEHVKSAFLPIFMSMAVASVHRLSQSEMFKDLLHRLPLFATDWANALMGTFDIWGQPRLGRAGRLCYECAEPINEGTVDTLRWVRSHRLIVMCDGCYRLPALGEWEADS